jgi:cell division protein FtsB
MTSRLESDEASFDSRNEELKANVQQLEQRIIIMKNEKKYVVSSLIPLNH